MTTSINKIHQGEAMLKRDRTRFKILSSENCFLPINGFGRPFKKSIYRQHDNI